MKTREQTILAMGRDIERELADARIEIGTLKARITQWETIEVYLMRQRGDEFGKRQRAIILGACERRNGNPDCDLGMES